jgi:hypothetical protein
LPDELPPLSDTSNIVRIIGGLCLNLSVNVASVWVFFKENPNDPLLVVLHPAA